MLRGGKAPESQPMVLRGTFFFFDLLPVLLCKKETVGVPHQDCAAMSASFICSNDTL